MLTLTCAGDAVHTGSEVLDDGHGASLHGKDAGQLEDDVLGAGPAAELPRQLDTDNLKQKMSIQDQNFIMELLRYW